MTGAGQAATFSFLVTNTGEVDLSAVTVKETAFTGSGSLTTVNCPNDELAVGASMTCTADYVTTEADVAAGAISNTATATAQWRLGPLESDPSSVTLVLKAPVPTPTPTPTVTPTPTPTPTPSDTSGPTASVPAESPSPSVPGSTTTQASPTPPAPTQETTKPGLPDTGETRSPIALIGGGLLLILAAGVARSSGRRSKSEH